MLQLFRLPTGQRRNYRTAGRTVALTAATLLMAAPAMAASGPTGHDKIPTAMPSTISPAVTDGQVNAIVQVGSTMVIGGTFTKVTPPGGSSTTRSRIAFFDAATGRFPTTGFTNPVLNAEVMEVLEGPLPDTVYVAGKFTTVNGAATSHLALFNVKTGAQLPTSGAGSFRAATTNGAINTITRATPPGCAPRTACDRLLLGGNFTTAGGQSHLGLAAVNAATGGMDASDHAFMGIDVSERHNNSGSGALGAIGVKDMEATPDGTKMVVVGNFRKADGLDRQQVIVVNLTGTAVVAPTWRTRRYEPLCYSWAFDTYMRGVAVSPDGSFFVISTTGGGTRGTLCDSAARWEFNSSGQELQPTWADNTGGDTLWSAEITETAVYVGGHQRWQNNVDGVDYANQGAVPRPGLAALDIESGVPIAWNPGRLPRGAAAFSIYASPTGLWVGSDTDYIGNWKYKRPRLAYFPLAGGAPQASDQPVSLPGDVYLGGRTSTPNTLSRVANFDGTAASANGPTNISNRGMSWDSMRGSFLLGDTLFYGKTDGYLYKRTFTSSTTGAEVRIDPYNDPLWVDAPDGVGGTERGRVPSFYGQIPAVSGLFASDDRIYFTRGDSHLYWRWFNADSGIIGSQVFTADGGRSWSDTGGLFKSGNSLYIVSKSTGRLWRMAFTNGAPSGTATVLDTARDWRARNVFIGLGGAPANAAPTAAFTETHSGSVLHGGRVELDRPGRRRHDRQLRVDLRRRRNSHGGDATRAHLRCGRALHDHVEGHR